MMSVAKQSKARRELKRVGKRDKPGKDSQCGLYVAVMEVLLKEFKDF
jgi:hypothetical protein